MIIDIVKSMRANIVVFAVMLYYFMIARSFVQPYVLVPVYQFFGIYPLLGWVGILNVFFRDLGIPVLLYCSCALLAKQKIRPIFSISRLSLTNMLYITIMTLAVRIIFNLIESGIPFLLSGSVPMQTFRFMDIGQSLIHNALLATFFEEAVFRGFLWGEYLRQNTAYWKIAFATGLFFGIIHLGTFTMTHTALAGIFFYAPLIYLTRSIFAPILHHALMNGLYTLTNLVFYIDNQADFDAFMPVYLTILVVATIILTPIAIWCGKRFYHENRHNAQAKESLSKETKAFNISYWILIVVMIATFVRS
ncbi:MAG: CPBP family intramembrane metalloprotease [Defluviitaleaceae bacterium]|nr:CPBP family intramembrane metalloprotease [Defluviitaleaceae bacterium]